MSASVTGFIVGVLASSSLAVAVPNMAYLRWTLAAMLLSGSIITAAWYLP